MKPKYNFNKKIVVKESKKKGFTCLRKLDHKIKNTKSSPCRLESNPERLSNVYNHDFVEEVGATGAQ